MFFVNGVMILVKNLLIFEFWIILINKEINVINGIIVLIIVCMFLWVDWLNVVIIFFVFILIFVIKFCCFVFCLVIFLFVLYLNFVFFEVGFFVLVEVFFDVNVICFGFIVEI